MIPIQKKSSQITFLECAAVGVTVLFASSPRILRFFPNASRQGIFLCGGALMVSSFLYNHFRNGPHPSYSQQTLEKGLVFSAVSLSTSLISRKLPLSLSLTLSTISTIPILFAAHIAKKDSTSNIEQEHAYYTEHLEEWIDLDIDKRTTLFNAFFKANLPPIFAWVDFSMQDLLLTPDVVDRMQQTPNKFSDEQLSWFLLLAHPRSTLILYSIEHQLPLGNFFVCDDNSTELNQALHKLFIEEPIYFYLFQNELEDIKPSSLPTLETLAQDLTPEKIDAMPPHLIKVWHTVLKYNSRLELPLHIDFKFHCSFSKRNLDSYLDFSEYEEDLFLYPEKYSDKDVIFHFQRCSSYRDVASIPTRFLPLFARAHKAGISLPLFCLDEGIPEENSPEAIALKEICEAYPYNYYSLKEYHLIDEESWFNKLQIATPHQLLEKLSPETVHSMSDQTIYVWYSIFNRHLQNMSTLENKKAISSLMGRFIKAGFGLFPTDENDFEWVYDLIDPVDLQFLTLEDIQKNYSRLAWCEKIFFKKVPFDQFSYELDEDTVRLVAIVQKAQDDLNSLVPPLFQFNQAKWGGLPSEIREYLISNPPNDIILDPEGFAQALKRRVSENLFFFKYQLVENTSLDEECFVRDQLPDLLLPLNNRYVEALTTTRIGHLPKTIDKFKAAAAKHRFYDFLSLRPHLQEALRKAFRDEAHLLPYIFTKEFIAQAKKESSLQDQIVAQSKAISNQPFIDFGFSYLSSDDKEWIKQLLTNNHVVIPRRFK